jgi:Tol biopolymer transport system component
VSRDGTAVAFESAASNLTGQTCGLITGCQSLDKNSADDVFLYNVGDRSVTLISGLANGAPGNGASNRPSLNENGRRIAFASTATNLTNDTNGAVEDVFVRDLASGDIIVASTGTQGQGDKNSGSPSLSANGRWVSFDSKATNFAAGDSGGDTDVFIRDLETPGAIEQLSVKGDRSQASPGSLGVVGGDSTISANGQFVAFWSDSSNLVPDDTNGTTDVFVRDRVAGTITRITSTNGAQGDGDSYSPALSLDGRFVALDSLATTLDSTGGSASSQDIFVHVNF